MNNLDARRDQTRWMRAIANAQDELSALTREARLARLEQAFTDLEIDDQLMALKARVARAQE